MSWSFNKVRKALIDIRNDLCMGEDIKYSVYYIGGSLCVDFNYHPSVLLNKNGRGFFYKFPKNTRRKAVGFVITNEMKELVNQIYNICKGKGSEHEFKSLTPTTTTSRF